MQGGSSKVKVESSKANWYAQRFKYDQARAFLGLIISWIYV